MSEGSDQEYKPILHGERLQVYKVDRPRRLTRKEVDYKEQVIVLESDEETERTSKGVLEGNRVENWAARSRLTLAQREGSELGSDSTVQYCSKTESVLTDTLTKSAFWSPRTLQARTSGLIRTIQEVQHQVTMATEQSKGSATSIEAMMQLLVQARIDDQVRDRRREQEREERRQEEKREDERREARRVQEEYEREEKRQEREDRLLLAIKEAQPAVPQTVQIHSCKLPKMKEGEDITSFIELFEAALQDYNIPHDQWKARVHNALDTPTKLRVRDTITNHGSTYEELKTALLGCSSLSFSHASDTIMTGDRGSIFLLPPRQAFQRWQNLLERLTAEATDIKSACAYMAAALLRYNCTLDLKTYIDTKGEFERDIFCRNVEEWLATRPAGVTWCRQGKQPASKPTVSLGGHRKGSCYHCGKAGHFAIECRSRLAGDKPSASRQDLPSHIPTPVTKPEPVKEQRGGRDLSQVTCFRCRQQGHISPNCPKKPTSKVRRVRIQEDLIQTLKENEVFGAVGPYRMPITLDTGADITVVPEESVEQDQFTGETCELRSFNDGKSRGKKCLVQVMVGGHRLTREAVTQPGDSLGWSVCLRLNLADKEDRTILLEQVARRAEMDHNDLLYVPPEVREGVLLSGVTVDEIQIVKGVKVTAPKSIQVPVQAAQAEAPEIQVEAGTVVESGKLHEGGVTDEEVGKDEGTSEQCLEKAEEESSPVVGRAEDEGESDLRPEKIREGMMREDIQKETSEDVSLRPLLQLGEANKEGYYLVSGVLMRSRRDSMGENVTQMCVPAKHRSQCLRASHNSFGHQGRNKMLTLLRQYFYWPNMSRACRDWVKGCDKCQAVDKTMPKHQTMIQRSIVTQPFSDVSIDLVGPFPKAVGGYTHLLTCIDAASRWPEAVPMTSTTSKSVINCLTNMFSRNGFPEKLTSDNGAQFTSKQFTQWLREQGIAHSKSTPYHPQGNGMVERLHRTLGSIVAKTTEKKGNWARVVPLALYFLRCTPSRATGVSPFMITHGWEPKTPLRVLYQSWVQQDMGGVDLSEWVSENQDRVEAARDLATSTATQASTKRAEVWNKTAVDRHFSVGDKVWVRRPGLDEKLRESWVGPATIVKQNSKVSYRVQTDERLIPTVHVQRLKAAHSQVKRVTSMLEEDSNNDDITDRFAEAHIQEQTLDDTKKEQLKKVLEEYREVLNKEPGLTSLVEFSIDTGDADPIHQHPYNTPATLKASVDREIDWLLNRKFIRPSSSPWASPMVTVKKADGSARLCVDFRKINGLTRQTPFYMPRVEEVLEGVGRSKYISKLDLSKGYYQVQLAEQAIPKTAFTSHRGVFEFTRMPFGVRNAPACFQELMQRVLREQRAWATAYMDDVVVYSTSWDDHLIHIASVLQALKQAGLTANPDKCRWGGRAIEFLGHWIGAGSMTIPDHKIEALGKYTRPQTKRGLRAFIGSVSFYRRYIQQLAQHTAILTPMTAKQAPQRLQWTAEGEEAFRCICDFFCHIPILCIPELHDVVSIVTDASGRGIGGVLQVQRGGDWQPAAYYSRQLRGAEVRYSATELEALALVETVSHFGHYLYGKTFKAFTDHKPLEQLVSSTRLNPRLARMSFKLQHWLIEIVYLPGELNTLADALSREERARESDQTTQSSAEPAEDESRGAAMQEGDNPSGREEDVEIPRHPSSVGGCGGNASTGELDHSSLRTNDTLKGHK